MIRVRSAAEVASAATLLGFPMVVAVRCPNPRCRKFMLVEEHQRGQIVSCLICKEPIKVPAPPNEAKPLS